jgi:xylulokinase
LNQHINTIDRTLVGASNNLGGGIIEWYKQAFFGKENGDVYSKMENQCQMSKVGAGGIIFLPYLLGERAPFINPDARGSFFGISRNSTITDFTRAVFESTGYVTKDLMDLIENSGFPIESITVRKFRKHLRGGVHPDDDHHETIFVICRSVERGRPRAQGDQSLGK